MHPNPSFVPSANPAFDPTASSAGSLVVINHHATRLFRTLAPGSTAEHLHPNHAENAENRTRHSTDFSRGQEKPAANTFFEPVARALQDVTKILLCGSGTGAANEMEQFAAWLKVHHADLARRIVGTLNVDLHHLTDGQLLAHAREFYALPSVPVSAAS